MLELLADSLKLKLMHNSTAAISSSQVSLLVSAKKQEVSDQLILLLSLLHALERTASSFQPALRCAHLSSELFRSI